VALELSSFKCGHDAPIYTVVEEIVEHSGTPYFCFKDIDENKPTGSIKIRVETIGYFLKRYREDMIRNKQKANTIEDQLKGFEARLRPEMLREKLDKLSDAFETGAMPQIHVTLGQLAASKPVEHCVWGDLDRRYPTGDWSSPSPSRELATVDTGQDVKSSMVSHPQLIPWIRQVCRKTRKRASLCFGSRPLSGAFRPSFCWAAFTHRACCGLLVRADRKIHNEIQAWIPVRSRVIFNATGFQCI